MSTRVVRLKTEKRDHQDRPWRCWYIESTLCEGILSKFSMVWHRLGTRLRNNYFKECESCSQIKEKAQKSKGNEKLFPVFLFSVLSDVAQ